jgi:hypothetical protein
MEFIIRFESNVHKSTFINEMLVNANNSFNFTTKNWIKKTYMFFIYRVSQNWLPREKREP